MICPQAKAKGLAFFVFGFADDRSEFTNQSVLRLATRTNPYFMPAGHRLQSRHRQQQDPVTLNTTCRTRMVVQNGFFDAESCRPARPAFDPATTPPPPRLCERILQGSTVRQHLIHPDHEIELPDAPGNPHIRDTDTADEAQTERDGGLIK